MKRKVGRPPRIIVNGRARYGTYQHYCLDCKTEICREAIKCRSCSHKGIKRPDSLKRKLSKMRMGNKNPNWKGREITYMGLHTWIKRKYHLPKVCEKCGKKKPEWANKSGKYLRDRNDWIPLCRSCHMKYDKGRR